MHANHPDNSPSPTIAVLIPCYNEAVTTGKVVDDYRETLPQADIYVYDNNSTDDTAAIALAHGAIVRKETRQGKGNVVRSMFREIDADVYLMVDGDDTYPAQAASKLIAPILTGEADMTVGDRLSNGSYGKENKRALHGFGNNLVRLLITVLYGYSFDDVMTGYRAFSRSFVKTAPVMSEGFQVETEISIHAVDKRWRVADIPIDYRDRPEGSTSKLSTLGDGMLVLRAITSLFRDYKPMAFFGWFALILLICGLIAGLPVILEYRATHFITHIPLAVLATALVICAALSFTTGTMLSVVAKNHRRLWELNVYRVMNEQDMFRQSQKSKAQ